MKHRLRLSMNRRRQMALAVNARKKRLSKLDPTRTLTLRRAFAARLKRKFALLRGKIVRLIGQEDAFGLKARQPLAANFDPGEERDTHGRWVKGEAMLMEDSEGTDPHRLYLGPKEVPVKCGKDIERAAVLLSRGYKIRLSQPEQVSTLLDKMHEMTQEAIKKGEAAPEFDLCGVTVKKTNLFCQESKGIPRAQMPQLKGEPVPGSYADSLPKNKKGKVDLSREFIEDLKGSGVGVTDTKIHASYLRASQSEIVGGKIAQLVKEAEAGTRNLTKDTIFVTRDNYVLDGHHHWVAIVGLGYKRDKDIKIPVHVVDMDIGEAIERANAFSKAKGIASKAATITASSSLYQPFVCNGEIGYFPAGRLLEVEDVPQDDNSSCGAAAFKSAAEYVGTPPRPISEWKRLLGTTTKDGTDPEPMIRVARALGLIVDGHSGMTLDDLSSFLQRGMPVLCPVQDYFPPQAKPSAMNYGHWLCVIGRSMGYIFAQDPSISNVQTSKGQSLSQIGGIHVPGRVMIREDDWLRCWRDTDRDGNVLIHYGIAVGRSPTTANYDPDEERDEHGRWIGGPSFLSEGIKGYEEDLSKKATHYLDKIPGAKWLREKVASLKGKMEARYGKKTAATIFATANAISWGAFVIGPMIGYPNYIPASSLMAAGAAVAEVHYQYKVHIKPLISHNVESTPTDLEIHSIAKGLIIDLADFYTKQVNRLTANTRWAFETDPNKVEAFQEWLKSQFKSDLTGPDEESLWDKYIQAGFKKGAGRSYDDVTKPMTKGVGIDPAKTLFAQGSKDQFLRTTLWEPTTVDRVKMLAGRAFDELENVTSDMSNKMSRVLADGLTKGMSPQEVARSMARQVDLGLDRALLISQTELIRVHAEGQLTALENLGIEEVGVEVELATADDEAVCDECLALEGSTFTIDEARGLIPVHPGCRCAFIPSVPALNAYHKRRVILRNQRMRDESGQFGPGKDHGLSIPRSLMPQIPSARVDDFIKYVRAIGVGASTGRVAVSSLHPVQKEFRQERVDSIPETALDEPVVISSDNFILDGTHRWVKAWQLDPKMTMPIVRLGVSRDAALEAMRHWDGAVYATNSNPNRDAKGRFAKADELVEDIKAAHEDDSSHLEYRKARRLALLGRLEVLRPEHQARVRDKLGLEGDPFHSVNKHLKDREVETAGGTAVAPTAPTLAPTHTDSTDHSKRVAESVRRLGVSSSNLVHLGDLRDAHPELGKEQFEKAIAEAEHQGLISLSSSEGRHGLSQGDLDSSILRVDPLTGRKEDRRLYASHLGVSNAFCKTGKGGGVDPTCTKEGSSKKIQHGLDHPGAAEDSKVRVKGSKDRAISPELEPTPLETRLTKQETGRIGEAVILAWMKSTPNMKDARPLNSGRKNEAIDSVADHMAPEIKTGLASNGKDAQKWRITFSMELSKEAKAEYTAMSSEEKTAFNAKMQQACLDRKQKKLEELSKELGHKIKPVTVTCVLNPDKRVADIYVTDGYHPILRWKDAKRVASVEYDHA